MQPTVLFPLQTPHAVGILESNLTTAAARLLYILKNAHLVPPHAVRLLDPHLWPDEFVQHTHDSGVIYQERRWTARHSAVLGWQGVRIVLDAPNLVADGRDFIGRDDRWPHEEPGKVEAEPLLVGQAPL